MFNFILMIQLKIIGVFLLHAFSNAFITPRVSNLGVYSLNPIRKDVAADVLEDWSINVPSTLKSEIQAELSTAHSWCTQHKYDDHYLVSLVTRNFGNKNSAENFENLDNVDYVVLYRQNREVFTVAGLVRIHRETLLTISDVFLMLRKQCDSQGYLQLHELKTWCTGRYPIESFLEDMITMELT